jgi:hypothetical protein
MEHLWRCRDNRNGKEKSLQIRAFFYAEKSGVRRAGQKRHTIFLAL